MELYHQVPVLQFRLRLSPKHVTFDKSTRPLITMSSFGETFPVLFTTCKVHDLNESSQSVRQSAASNNDGIRLPEISFNRLQLNEQELHSLQKQKFGRYVAREAVLDEEYWTAAWLRAEAHVESVSCLRHVDIYKRKYAEQEFYALKRRCMGQYGNSLKCFCFVAVKREEKNVKRTVLNSVVGTLDLSIKQYLQGETYPGEQKRFTVVLASAEPYDAHKYAYIANVCVSKFARRQGIATNMVYLATDAAVFAGMKQLFVHVNTDNMPALGLYKKAGFKILEASSSLESGKERLLLSMDL